MMESPESDEGSGEYDAMAKELGEVLQLPESKAQQLRDIICGLARQEMEGETEEPELEVEVESGGKGKGLAGILG